MSESINVRKKSSASAYRIAVGVPLAESGPEIRDLLGPDTRRIVIVSNKKVFGLYGVAAGDALRKNGFDATVHLIGDGERFKNLRTLEKTLAAFSSAGLSRTDAVVALGGGVVGD